MVGNHNVIAFIPVRGGSKSIPLKNIKLFCGKPLVCWNIEALESCRMIDKVVVATDSSDIERVVTKQSYSKTEIYHRSAESASDTASTENVMLEYINKEKPYEESIFILVQATSPLTQSSHFSEALRKYTKGNYDSLLTCVRNYRFFWNENGTSMNYDYLHRPRRQEFDGMLMENGAFYINTVKNIASSGNRLSGKIGIYEMPDYTATEIDEPDDWLILESLMRRHVLSHKEPIPAKVRLFISDIDGTLTDGGMYYSELGDELKKFNTRDGMAFQLLRNCGVLTGIITSEDRQLNQRRAGKLNVDYFMQGRQYEGKLSAAKAMAEKAGCTLRETAYIGDDVNCIELLSNVGFAACPADACPEVKAIPSITVLSRKGGEGCVREWADWLKENYLI